MMKKDKYKTTYIGSLGTKVYLLSLFQDSRPKQRKKVRNASSSLDRQIEINGHETRVEDMVLDIIFFDPVVFCCSFRKS